MHDKIKDIIQDCNINFLMGSGLSSPYLKTLGSIETLLSELEKRGELDSGVKKIIRASLYKKYFDEVIEKNPNILIPDADVLVVLEQYRFFLKALNSILLKRKVTLLSKEANIFTTNVDIFLEKALEDLNLEYNDGFNGRFEPKFSLSNFKKSHFKKSLHYDNTAELPVFNLSKLHGSLSWEIKNNDVIFSYGLEHIKKVAGKNIDSSKILPISDTSTIDTLIAAATGMAVDPSLDIFMEAYESLLIVVNPTKEKFKHTLMNQTYYELLRLYSNELEKENTVLFVMGFSFSDEHICEITLRAANSNPTLMIYVIAHSAKAKKEIGERFGKNNIKNNNIEIISPEQIDGSDGLKKDEFKYDFPTINKKIIDVLLHKINCEDISEKEPTNEGTNE